MRIAINTRFLLPTKMEGFGWYTYEITKRIVENHPEHEFYFFFDRPFDQRFVFSDNVTPVVLSPPARHPFLFIWWFEVAVKRALKKFDIDLFFSPDGYLSLSSSVTQIGVIHDLNFVHNPRDLKPLMSWYYNRYFPKFARKSKAIITVSEFSKNDIIEQYDVPSSKVHAIWNSASPVFQPISSAEKELIRAKYTNGKPFILFVGALHPRKNLKRLMLAFDQLKQDQNYLDVQLLIVGEELWKNGLEDVQISPVAKKSIKFTGHLDQTILARVTASAELLAFVPYFEGFGIPLVEAMRCGTPILSGNKSSLPEVAGKAAVYCDPFSVDDIAKGLVKILSDSELQIELSQHGVERSTLFSWDRSAEEVWRVIESSLPTS